MILNQPHLSMLKSLNPGEVTERRRLRTALDAHTAAQTAGTIRHDEPVIAA
jgi:hypothetical protein